MNQPVDQRQLYNDLCQKLESQSNPGDLINFMGAVLRSLLRRKGDAEFLMQVQDAFTTGLAGLPWGEQLTLAREVIGLVIAKRPEISQAWQKLQGDEAVPPHQRRASDVSQPPPDDLPDLDLIKEDLALDVVQPDTPTDEDDGPDPSYEFGLAEKIVADHVSAELESRLAVFAAPETRFPSVAYCHEHPFFLVTPVFAKVARRFVSRVVIPLCREPMENLVFRSIPADVRADAKALEVRLGERWADVVKILLERLSKLAAQHAKAEAQVEAARKAEGQGPEFKVVEVPVSRPRVFRALGVAFRVGSRTTLERKKVRVRPSTELDICDLEVLDLIARFRDMAAEAGLELPAACDFTFLRTLLEFDAKNYGQAVKDFAALAGQKETTCQQLQERLNDVEKTYTGTLADALVILQFYGTGDATFGFKNVHDIAIGADTRPFLSDEIGRRPRELAFQVREVLRRRSGEDSLLMAVKALLDVWQAMSRANFNDEMEAALTVLAAFPIAFAGDRDEQAFTAISQTLQQALATKELALDQTMTAVIKAYRPVVAKPRQ